MQAIEDLERGRESYARRAWLDAHESLSRADRSASLGADGLELLATSAYMIGRDDEWASTLERAHQAHLDAGEALRAVRCAFWLCLSLALRGETGRATGWLGRAQRLLEREQRDCVERGYLLIPIAAQLEASGDHEDAYALSAQAAEIGGRFGDADLLAIAVHEQGIVLVKLGRVEEGLALLDEAMVAVTAGELSPIVTGLVYCSVIDGCQQVYALRRAQEWTDALTRWCAQQPDMVAFTGRCLVHRAEIMQFHGAWSDALAEARRAGERCAEGRNELASAEAYYRQGEVHRLQGRFVEAEEAYREASLNGREPQPGLALLRLSQGNPASAAAAIRRVLGERSEPLLRAGLLPACVDIMLAVGDREQARVAGAELERIAAGYGSAMLDAMVAHARGAIELAGGDAHAALVALRQACRLWQELQAPYDAARSRVLVGLACRALGDDDAAVLELDGARSAFEGLDAAPDLAHLDTLAPTAADRASPGLTERELQVLRLVAGGATNKAIAAELVLSERTVDRHVSNIFAKVRVSSRAAATAYAYEHELI
ncbi:MAG: helix-turn-helix transcriptional regulator [Thermoleophilaceae bacterium]|nr:helix-turn-helix transcriptional regulator [Thermoleophilaceae bacterium]